MRQLTKLEIDRIKILTEKSVELCLIEPTGTGLEKSIMDATGSVRTYLKASNIHDYELQKQGAKEHGVYVKTNLVIETKLIETNTSLYRPKAKGKSGDPRIWISKLPELVNANDIVGLIAFENELYILNITRLDLQKLIESIIANPLQDLVNDINKISNQVAEELLYLLRKIALNPVSGLLQADTSIGRTLERLLGIEINSSKKPDYKGIELKSYRDKKNSRKNLFAQVPEWDLSKFKSSTEILNNFGYSTSKGFRFYCTVSSTMRNPNGLLLKVDSELQQLIENSSKASIGDFAVWSLGLLHRRLLEKHSETFWVAADSIMIEDKEHFQFTKVRHTRKPIISQFDMLLEQGAITLDHLIDRTATGRADEKGPIFKLKPKGLDLLFPPSQSYSLLST
jgi:hypothetical protein